MRRHYKLMPPAESIPQTGGNTADVHFPTASTARLVAHADGAQAVGVKFRRRMGRSLVNGEFAVVESGGKNIRQLKLTDANAAGDSNCLI